MNTAHIFSGAGGGLLADLILGHTPVHALDNDENCILNLEGAKENGWFPELKTYCQDIRNFDASVWRGSVDLLHAGIPCPKWSTARRGQGRVFDGVDETCRIIRQSKPSYVFIECVANFKREHGRLSESLREIGYFLGDYIITDASGLGSPHARSRYWSLAHANDESKPVRRQYAKMAVLPPFKETMWWETPPRVSGVDDGVADRVYRFKATGNGQVPLQSAQAYLILGGF